MAWYGYGKKYQSWFKNQKEKGIQITDAIKELKDVLSQHAQQIKPKLEALKAIVNEVTTEQYKNASPHQGDQPGQQQEGEQNAG